MQLTIGQKSWKCLFQATAKILEIYNPTWQQQQKEFRGKPWQVASLSKTKTTQYLPLSPARASISSKNTIAGAAARAWRNTSLTARSDSPTHLENSSGPLMATKLMPLSRARALAIMVLLQPGTQSGNLFYCNASWRYFKAVVVVSFKTIHVPTVIIYTANISIIVDIL